jgi:radical SAM superfamily enzyme YgiQ (UPF0313 family)
MVKNELDLLCVEPWIEDFSAYDLWAEPLGLLTVASAFRAAGARVRYVNCLRSAQRPNPEPKENGSGKYIRTVIEKPGPLAFVPRLFARYGMDEDEFERAVRDAAPIDAALVTSHMTYWYPGVRRAVGIVKKTLRGAAPVLLGGIYAKLCADHARRVSGADEVYAGDLSPELFRVVEKLTGKTFGRVPEPLDFPDYPSPLHELHARGVPERKRFFALLTLRGCPYRCAYCASPLLCRSVGRRRTVALLDEIETYARALGARNLAFYDDALLLDAENHALPLLRGIAEKGVGLSIHLPNGVHARFVTKEVAVAFRDAGVKTVRVGLETSDEGIQKKAGQKISNDEFREAVRLLREAGYSREETGAYILVGLPGQKAGDVERTICFAHDAGAGPHLSAFSPIPGTPIWGDAARATRFPIEEEPLFHNKSVYILGNPEFPESAREELKRMALELRHAP